MRERDTLCSIVFVLCFFFILFTNPINAQVIPNDEWITSYSRNTTFQGGPVPIGAVVEAFDPDSVLCGSFTVTIEGEYGFLFVYRDDTLTVDVDEGAVPGDTITFKINGFPVKALGPDTSIWTENGDIFELDLADNLSPTKLESIATIVLAEDSPDTIIVDLDSIFFDPDNDSLKFSAQASKPRILPIIDEENQLIISLAPDSSGEAMLIVTAGDAWFTIYDTLLVKIMAINDPPVILYLPDTSFCSDTTLTIDLNQYVEDVDHPRSTLIWTADVEPFYAESLFVEINNTDKLANFTATTIFSAQLSVVFTVTDDSSASDTAAMAVEVKLPVSVEYNEHYHRPTIYFLNQNYPNPFNATTIINYQLPKSSRVKIKIVNSLGQQVALLVDEMENLGYYSAIWDAKNQASGLYFVWIEAGEFFQVRKMVLLR